MVHGIVLVHQLAGFVIEYLGAGQGGADPFQDGLGVLLGRGSAVIAVQEGGIIGIGAHHRQALQARREGQDAVVLEEHHGFAGCLHGQGVMFGAADNFGFQARPGQFFGRVEHTQFEAAPEHIAEGIVDVGLADKALLQAFLEETEAAAALQVGAVEDGVYGSVNRVGMGLVLSLGVEVVDGVAVGEDDAVVTPLVAEDVHEQAVAHAAGIAFVALVGAHYLAHLSVDHQGLESRKVGFPEVAHGNGYVHAVAERFGTAVHGIVLGARMGLVVSAVEALHAQDGLQAHHAGQVRVFPAGLLAAPPAGIPEDVHIGAPEGELRIGRVVAGVVPHVPLALGAVPVGTGLIAHRLVDLPHLHRVERGRQADVLRIHGVVRCHNPMAGLAPPVIGRNAQPVHGDRLVHHQTHLLFRGKEGKQVFHPVVRGKSRVLERILVPCPLVAGDHQRPREGHRQ